MTADELKQVPVSAVRPAQPMYESLKSARKRQREPGEYLVSGKLPFEALTAVPVDENEDAQPPEPKRAPSSASPMQGGAETVGHTTPSSYAPAKKGPTRTAPPILLSSPLVRDDWPLRAGTSE